MKGESGKASRRLVTWEEKWTPHLEHELRQLMGHLKSSRVPFFSVDAACWRLCSFIELSRVESDHLKRSMVKGACLELQGCSAVTADAFRDLLTKRVQTYHAKPVHDYTVLLPFNVNKGALKRSWLLVDDNRFYVSSWPVITRRFEFDEWQTEVRHHWPFKPFDLLHQFIPLLVTVKTRSAKAAMDGAYVRFDFLRAASNLAASILTDRIALGARPQEFAKVQQSPVFAVFDEQGHLEEPYFEQQRPRKYSTGSIKPYQMDRALELVRELRDEQSEHSTLRLVREAVLTYGRGMDSSDWSTAFLAFWQVIEVLFSDFDQATRFDELVKRACGVLGQGTALSNMVDPLRIRRNELVHKGKFSDDGQTDARMMKAIADHCIDIVYSKRQLYPNRQSLLAYYDYGRLPHHQLASKIEDLDEELRVARSLLK